MAGAGKKTFTAGEVLTASDVNTYLMEQSVMYFGGTAARASAIPTPSTGMTTYIGVTGTASIPQIETYTGSAWQTPYGLTLLTRATFTSASAFSIDNVFNSTYNSYRIEIIASASGAVDVTLQNRVAGVPANTNYNFTNVQGLTNTASSTTNTSQTAAPIGRLDTNGGYIFCDIVNPALAARTYGHSVTFDSANVLRTIGFVHTTATAYDGITLVLNNSTGTVRVYGLRS
jgi:hypothetical protein